MWENSDCWDNFGGDFEGMARARVYLCGRFWENRERDQSRERECESELGGGVIFSGRDQGCQVATFCLTLNEYDVTCT